MVIRKHIKEYKQFLKALNGKSKSSFYFFNDNVIEFRTQFIEIDME